MHSCFRAINKCSTCARSKCVCIVLRKCLQSAVNQSQREAMIMQLQLRARSHERSVLLLLKGSPWLLSSLLITALLFISSPLSLLLFSLSLSLALSLLSESALWPTWNRSCFDDVPEVLGSAIPSLFLQITVQINTLAPADPQWEMPPEARPSGPAGVFAACHRCQHSAGRDALN